MTVRDIRLFGDPVLKSVCDEVKVFDEKLALLAEDLLDTTTKLSGRAGVAAGGGARRRAASRAVNRTGIRHVGPGGARGAKQLPATAKNFRQMLKQRNGGR